MFDEKQRSELSQAINQQRIKTRDKAGINLAYLETYDVINEANRIFNYMWNYTITKLEEVSRDTNQNGNQVITFSSIIKIKIFDVNGNFIEREDTGVGIGTARNIGDAIDNASKSAVSDGLKRCFRTMGATFGNDLYAKGVNNQNNKNSQSQNFNQQQNYNQAPNNYQQNNSYQNSQNQYQYQQDFQQLINLGLQVIQKGEHLIVVGENVFANKDVIKNHGFRWDGSSKTWYMQLRQAA